MREQNENKKKEKEKIMVYDVVWMKRKENIILL